MMKKLLSVFGLILILSGAYAQKIKGRVINTSDGSPVSSATIKIRQLGSKMTDENGYFEFAAVNSGSYSLNITSIGFRSVSVEAEPSEDIQIFHLENLKLFLKPVEITAIRAGDKSPFTKTNMGKTDIASVNLGQDLPYIINQTPSVIVSSDAGNGVGYTGIRIRGTDATRINMTINGIPYNDAESQGLFFVNLPDLASSVNSIQVQRGVGTSSNGAGAFGATINFSTNEVNTSPYAELSNSYGSFNTWKNTVKAGTGLLNDHFTLDARLSRITSNGYIDRATTDLSSFYLSGAYLSENTSLRFNIMSGKEKTYQAWNGVSESDLNSNRTINYAGTERPGEPYENETDNYQQDHYQFFVNHQLNTRLSLNTAFFVTKGRGYYEQYKAGENFSSYHLPDFISGQDTIRSTDLIRQLWLDNIFYGQVFSAQYKDATNELTFGGGWNIYEGQHFGEVKWAGAGIPDDHRWYEVPAAKTDINVYIKYLHTLGGNLDLFGDLQYRNVNYALNGFRDNPDMRIKNTYHFLNPKIGLSLRADASRFYLSYSQANKEPNRDDFEAGVAFQPKPEQLHDFELGWEFRRSGIGLGTTIYYMDYHDQLVLTGKINDVGSYTRTNIPRSFRLGIELQGTGKITKWMNLTGNLTFSRNRIINFTEFVDDYDTENPVDQKSTFHGNTDIAFSPSVTAAVSLQISPAKGFDIRFPGKYVSRQYLDNTSANSRSLDPFFVQDLQLIYTMRPKAIKEIQLILHVNNLFDKKYEPNGYTFSYFYDSNVVTENYYFPMAGINAMFGVNIKL